VTFTKTPKQEQAIIWASERDYAPLFMETGTGKTWVALELFQQWIVTRDARIVVVCMNTLTENWVLEAVKFGYQFKIARCFGTKVNRLKTIRGAWDVIVINYESLRNPEILAALKEARPLGLCFDEIQRLKDRRAKQTKAARELAEGVAARGGTILGLTGTPVVHSPPDLWSEFDVLSPGENPKTHPLGYGNFYAFEQGVANIKPHPRLGYRVKIYEYPDDKLAELKRRVAPLAFEASKDELGLPPRNFLPPTDITMGDEQAKVYKSLRDDYIAFLTEAPTPTGAIARLKECGVSPLAGNVAAMDAFHSIPALLGEGLDRQVSTTFQQVLQTRLQQVAAGHIRTDDGQIRELPNAKIDWLEDMLPSLTAEGWDNKVVIFCRFKYDVARLSVLCEKLRLGYVSLSGANSTDASSMVHRFQTEKRVRVFIGNVAIASVGITLTAANSCVFYTNSFNGEHRLQAIDRVYRIGQKRVVTYYDLCAAAVDRRILANLHEKDNLATKTVRNLLEIIE